MVLAYGGSRLMSSVRFGLPPFGASVYASRTPNGSSQIRNHGVHAYVHAANHVWVGAYVRLRPYKGVRVRLSEPCSCRPQRKAV